MKGSSYQIDCLYDYATFRIATIFLHGCLVIQNNAQLEFNKCFIYIASKNATIDMTYRTIHYNNSIRVFENISVFGGLRIRIATLNSMTLNVNYRADVVNASLENTHHRCNYIDITEKFLALAFIYYQMSLNITENLYDRLQLNERNALVTSNAQLGHMSVKQCRYCWNKPLVYRFIIYSNVKDIHNTTGRCYLAVYKHPECRIDDAEKLQVIEHYELSDIGILGAIYHQIEYTTKRPSYLTAKLYRTLTIQYQANTDRQKKCDYTIAYRNMYFAIQKYVEQSCEHKVMLYINLTSISIILLCSSSDLVAL